MKLSEWARANGVRRQSATRWFHAWVLPVPARQLATGTVLVGEPERQPGGVAIYARVSSGDQRGVGYIEAALVAQGRRLVVVDDTEGDDDLVRDMVEVLTSLCARLYGRRSAKRRAELALAAAGKAVA